MVKEFEFSTLSLTERQRKIFFWFYFLFSSNLFDISEWMARVEDRPLYSPDDDDVFWESDPSSLIYSDSGSCGSDSSNLFSPCISFSLYFFKTSLSWLIDIGDISSQNLQTCNPKGNEEVVLSLSNNNIQNVPPQKYFLSFLFL